MKKISIFSFCFCLALQLAAQFVAPYKISKPLDEPIFLGSFTLLTTSYFAGSTWKLPPQSDIANLNRNDVNIFDRSATYQHSVSSAKASDALLYSSIGLPLLHLLNKNCRHDYFKIVTIHAEVLVADLAVTELFKESIHRKRPFMYDPAVPVSAKYTRDNFTSFFSGHTSTVAAMSFCFATVFSQYNPDSKIKPLVWTLCAALPAATGVLRYTAGKHYFTDIITGYAIGALIGVGVPYLHSIKRKYNRQVTATAPSPL
jgi:PAP2 superfamily